MNEVGRMRMRMRISTNHAKNILDILGRRVRLFGMRQDIPGHSRLLNEGGKNAHSKTF